MASKANVEIVEEKNFTYSFEIVNFIETFESINQRLHASLIADTNSFVIENAVDSC